MSKREKDKKKVAEGVPPSAAGEDEVVAQKLLAELDEGKYKSSELVKRAFAIGVSPDDVAEAMDLDQVGRCRKEGQEEEKERTNDRA